MLRRAAGGLLHPDQGRLLRVLRHDDGDAPARGGRAGALRARLPARPRAGQRNLAGRSQRCARVGRGLLPRLRLGRVRPHPGQLRERPVADPAFRWAGRSRRPATARAGSSARASSRARRPSGPGEPSDPVRHCPARSLRPTAGCRSRSHWLVIVGLAALGLFAAWRRIPSAEPEVAYSGIARLATRLGHGPRPAQTAYEFAAGLGELVPVARERPADLIATAKVEATYGQRRPGESMLHSLAMAYRRVRIGLLRTIFKRPKLIRRPRGLRRRSR